MTMTTRTESLPRPVDELAALAEHYDTHDTAAEMERGEWVDPRPMKTTSLRLPAEVVEALKALAQARGVRYTAFLREVLEHAVSAPGAPDHDELAGIQERLAEVEHRIDIASPRIRVAVGPNLRHRGLTRRTMAGRRRVG